MKVGIYSNPEKDKNGKVSAKLKDCLAINSIEFTDIATKPHKTYPQNIKQSAKELCGLDFVIVIGGDGTILQVARECALADVPLFGINRGKLGFLSEIDETDIEDAILQLKNSNYTKESRRLMQIDINSESVYAVNEVFLSRAEHELIGIDIDIDGNNVDYISGDGVIVSTPTGSTAYSLSCGGPIISPDLNAMLVVGVCPHSLHSRPIVVNGESLIEMTPDKETDAKIIIDGKVLEMEVLNKISVTMCDKTAVFIRFNTQNFYNKLLKKMRNWSEAGND